MLTCSNLDALTVCFLAEQAGDTRYQTVETRNRIGRPQRQIMSIDQKISLPDIYDFILFETIYKREDMRPDLEINKIRLMLFEDITDFLEKFFEKYKILEGDFLFNRYFYYPPSLSVRFENWLRGHPPLDPGIEKEMRPFTPSMMLKAVQLGTWKTQEIEEGTATYPQESGSFNHPA